MFDSMFTAAALMLFVSAPESAPEPNVLDWAFASQQAQNLIIHVPRVTVTRATIVTRSMPAPPPPRLPMAMIEKKADDCIKIERIRGFSVSRGDSVDLMLRDGNLLRAKLGKNCPALGFYSGFYVKATPDKKMCAGRDAIRSRSGRQCGIEAFRSLVPAP